MEVRELFIEYADEHKTGFPNLIIPATRPVPATADIPEKFKGIRFDKGYETLNFKEFLKSKYPAVDLFTETYNRISIESLIKERHIDYSTDFFTQKGTKRFFQFQDLIYYQDEVGITGPRFSSEVGAPVLVVHVGSHHILYNGYHRCSVAMITNQKGIQGYALKL
jgi:hypothetical protein